MGGRGSGAGVENEVYEMIACLTAWKASRVLPPLRQLARETGQEYTFLWFAFV